MAIIGFWSASEKETGQTLAATALATYMGIKHNYKILFIDATFNDDVLERCFWRPNSGNQTAKLLNKGKIDISSGAEGLVSAVASNKITPEIITNFTRVVLKGRLDVLCGLKTTIRENFTKSIMLYKDILNIASKYYDLVFVDIEKTLKYDTTKALLGASHVIVADFTQNYRQFEEYVTAMASNKDIFKPNITIPLLTNSDENSKYNAKNVARSLKLKDLNTVLYNSVFKDSASEAGVANFFLRHGLSTNANDKNADFIKSLDKMAKTIEYKLEELNLKV